MSCGIFKTETILVVGDIDATLICKLAEKEATRVLHFISEPNQVATGENESYKTVEGDLTDRYFGQALFMQYEFSKIIVDRSGESGILPTIALEQWSDEYGKHLYIWQDGQKFGKLSFEKNSLSDISLSESEWQELAS
jgi:hypothetical protein